MLEQLIALIWFALFAGAGVLVLLADRGSLAPNLARLFRGNPDVFPPRIFGPAMIAVGFGLLLKSRLGGVVLDEDRITVRTSTVLGLPSVNMAYYAELRGAYLDGASVVLVQFDGSRFSLPSLASEEVFREALAERLATFRVPRLRQET
jgi:hypothetical protein